MTASLSTPGSSVMGRSAWLEPWLAALPAPAGPLETVQVRGRRALREQPLPSSRQEDWRFTDLSLLQQLQQAPGAGDAAPAIVALPPPAPGVPRPGLRGPTDPLPGVSRPAGRAGPETLPGDPAGPRVHRRQHTPMACGLRPDRPAWRWPARAGRPASRPRQGGSRSFGETGGSGSRPADRRAHPRPAGRTEARTQQDARETGRRRRTKQARMESEDRCTACRSRSHPAIIADPPS